KSVNSRIVKLTIRCTIHGSVAIVTRNTVTSRGTIVSVCSCTLVSVCRRLTTRLTKQAASSRGALNIIASISTFLIISTVWSGPIISSCSSVNSKTFNQLVREQVPSINHHKKQNLQWGRDHDGRQLHHAYGGRHARHHQIDQQKGKKQNRANLKSRLQLAQNISRHHNLNGEIRARLGPGFYPRCRKDLQILLACIPEHVFLDRGQATRHCLRARYRSLLVRSDSYL